MTLAIGDKAPGFALQGDAGPVGLAQFRRHPLVVYFYPKDDTSGCTAEAKDFTELAVSFAEVGAAVVGISKDAVASHGKFRAKYGLTHILASDPDGKVVEAFGVWVQKSLYGRSYMGIERATFLIDGAGVVRRIWRKVKVKGHAAEVLEATRQLRVATDQG